MDASHQRATTGISQWPKARRNQSAASARPQEERRPRQSNHSGRRQGAEVPKPPSRSPDAMHAATTEEVRWLEGAISVLGEGNPHAKSLVEAQKFIERARKRVISAETTIAEAIAAKERVVAELQDGERRLELLREEARVTMPTQLDPFGDTQMPDLDEVERMRRELQELRQFRDHHPAATVHSRSSPRRQHDASGALSMDGRPSEGFAGSPQHGKPQSRCQIEFDVDQGCRAHGRDESSGHFRRRVSVSCSTRRGSVRSLLKARMSRCHARYGLRASRVGEASHPGPSRKRRTQRMRGVPWSWDSDSEDEQPLVRVPSDVVASHPGPQLFRRARTRGGTRRQVVVLSSDDEPAVAGVQATQNDPESTQMMPSTVPATPVSLAQVGREFLTVPTDVVNAFERDLASHVADTQLDAPSFVHATQFDAFQDDSEDEEALPADPPPVIHHTCSVRLMRSLNQKEGRIQFQE